MHCQIHFIVSRSDPPQHSSGTNIDRAVAQIEGCVLWANGPSVSKIHIGRYISPTLFQLKLASAAGGSRASQTRQQHSLGKW